jgi:competence protein ComEA
MFNFQLAQFYHQTALLRGALLIALMFGLGPLALAAGDAAQTGDSTQSTSALSVNINTADAQSLTAGLKGIGPAKAEEIIKYRESYGPFSSVDELAEVKGVGKSTIEKNRSILTLE